MQTADRWAVIDRRESRRVIIMMGDFNLFLSSLHDWAIATNFSSLDEEIKEFSSQHGMDGTPTDVS